MTPGGALRRALAVTGANRALVVTRQLTAEPALLTSADRIVRALGDMNPIRRFAVTAIDGPLEGALRRMETMASQERPAPAGPSRRRASGAEPASRSASPAWPHDSTKRRLPPVADVGGIAANGIAGGVEGTAGATAIAPPATAMAFERRRDPAGRPADPRTRRPGMEASPAGARHDPMPPTPVVHQGEAQEMRGAAENPDGGRDEPPYGHPGARPPEGARPSMVSLADTLSDEPAGAGAGAEARPGAADQRAVGRSGELARLLSLWEVVSESDGTTPAAAGGPGSFEVDGPGSVELKAPAGPAPAGGPGSRTDHLPFPAPHDHRPQLEDVEDALDELLRREAERHGLEEGVA